MFPCKVCGAEFFSAAGRRHHRTKKQCQPAPPPAPPAAAPPAAAPLNPERLDAAAPLNPERLDAALRECGWALAWASETIEREKRLLFERSDDQDADDLEFDNAWCVHKTDRLWRHCGRGDFAQFCQTVLALTARARTPTLRNVHETLQVLVSDVALFSRTKRAHR